MNRRELAAHAAALSDRLGAAVSAGPTLDAALTHPSASSRAREDYQRLEFLGDRVLGLVIADALLERFPKAAEGDLAPRFNALVRKETCADVAAEIGLGPMLRLGKSEAMAGGRRKTAILGDAMEAVIAAVYLEGGLDAARTAVLTSWGGRLEAAKETRADAKTALQEWAQARGLAPPAYEVRGRSGPDHAPVFTVTARMADGTEETGAASSKRAAQQAAAAALMEKLEGGDD